MARHRHGRTCDLRVLLDRADVRADETDAADRLVHRGRTCVAETVDHIGARAFDVAPDDVFAHD